MTEHEENPRNGTDSPVMFVGGLVFRGIGAVAFLGGLALVVAGIVNFVHFHDLLGLPASIVVGYLFMLAGSHFWTETLADEPPKWRIRSAKVPQTSNGRSDVGKHRMNQGGPSIWRRIIVLGILAPILLAAGVIGLLWCRDSGATYCAGPGKLLASAVFAVIGWVIYLTLAGELPRWRIRRAKVPQTSNARSVVGKQRMNHGGPSIRRKIMWLGISAPIFIAAGIIGVLWCRRSSVAWCTPAAFIPQGVLSIIVAIYLYRRRDESGEDG
jgi:hypothetical protein